MPCADGAHGVSGNQHEDECIANSRKDWKIQAKIDQLLQR
jgi:hypothetical protein